MTMTSITDLSEAASVLRRLVATIDAGELTASASARYRIEGAVIALEALATGRVPAPGDLFDSCALHESDI
jgi:hypothetical protein